MIEEFSATNFKCLKRAGGKLTPLHAFIGPNDSGKSTILEALRTLANGAAGKALAVELAQDAMLTFTADGWDYTLPQPESTPEDVVAKSLAMQPNPVRQCGPARILHLDPREMREPSSLIVDTDPIDFQNDKGKGLAGVYDALQGRNVDNFVEINKAVVALFPTVRRIRLQTPGTNVKQLAVELVTGQEVKSPGMSDGLLYYLAFAALPYVSPLGLLLVEEPETGLHPARIREVVAILREVSKKTQVVMATHSPLVVNELEPEEVSVVTRHPEQGTRIRPISAADNFKERSKVYALGELWLSYANGEDERPLFADEDEGEP